ncbi:MAG: hypothetical protein JXR75_00825 [Rhodobacteraceae bacterium]|nr:hypothetical protein [Paracoccaceae bacterium]
MYWRLIAALAAGLAVAGCDGNPFGNEADCRENPFSDPAECTDEPAPDEGSVAELPGTVAPSAATPISRYEARDSGTGAGYAENITFDATTNTFTVDNLGFDGDNAYSQLSFVGTPLATPLGDFKVYEAAPFITDPVTGATIQQFQHRLLAGVSRTNETEFALVRTGAYINYGFGGFILKRNVAVTLPTSGQAGYTGGYAGLRDFEGRGGLEYTTGDMSIAIDFDDFNDGDAVQGQITNRRIFDMSGNDITNTVLNAWNTDPSGRYAPATALPTLIFTVGPNVIDANGELNGKLTSTVAMADGSRSAYEAGNYYAIVSGDNADEVVGVIVVTSEDPRTDNVTARETGGFILYRQP